MFDSTGVVMRNKEQREHPSDRSSSRVDSALEKSKTGNIEIANVSQDGKCITFSNSSLPGEGAENLEGWKLVQQNPSGEMAEMDLPPVTLKEGDILRVWRIYFHAISTIIIFLFLATITVVVAVVIRIVIICIIRYL